MEPQKQRPDHKKAVYKVESPYVNHLTSKQMSVGGSPGFRENQTLAQAVRTAPHSLGLVLACLS